MLIRASALLRSVNTKPDEYSNHLMFGKAKQISNLEHCGHYKKLYGNSWLLLWRPDFHTEGMLHSLASCVLKAVGAAATD